MFLRLQSLEWKWKLVLRSFADQIQCNGCCLTLHYPINLPWMSAPCITFQKYIFGRFIFNKLHFEWCEVLCWTQRCSWSATASELSRARWIYSHLNLFPQLSWYPWKKHWQRHNGPEGWVLLTKVTPLGHSTKSYTNLDQTSSESRPSTNFKISTKHQHFDKT